VKIESVEIIKNGVVWMESRVEISILKEQADELRQALSIVQKYEKLATQAFKHEFKINPKKDSDWCEVSYAVKNDRVFVHIRDGMAG
jgi:hypothetical protein